ncbi:CD3324 family protein [Paenibacillus antibioticophila]|uniref:CD3324 family protein n=1 Tax=Paenibacillus antibioticophila TaxID=1274374 RepID=UPI0005C85E01|nr:CD3324 family protein [Paenibacillus antibioticophila]
MKYKNADTVLPEVLLREIQKYIQGTTIYIPNTDGVRKKWGENSGSRELLIRRNREIRAKFSAGQSIDQLADTFCLSHDSIKRIVYTKKR